MSTGQLLAIIGSLVIIFIGVCAVNQILDDAPIEDEDLPRDEERE